MRPLPQDVPEVNTGGRIAEQQEAAGTGPGRTGGRTSDPRWPQDRRVAVAGVDPMPLGPGSLAAGPAQGSSRPPG